MADEEGPVDIPKGKLLGKRFRIKEKLGEGGCGAVYKVLDTKTGGFAALKAENNAVAGGTVLKLEVQILQKLRGKRGFVQLLHSGKKEKYSYMVMTLLGESLQKLTAKISCSSVSTQVRVGMHILYSIKMLHEVGYIHRDVKPANLAIGRTPTSTRVIHLLDFGLAREYVMRQNGKVEMRRPRTDTLFRGTTRYCSAATHTRMEQGRPDDLWSLVYVLVELRGSLPWEKCNDKKEIGRMKESTPDKKLLVNSPVQFLEICDHLRSLNYYTRPDYALIYKKLKDVCIQGGFKDDDPLDWEKGNAATVLTKKIKRTFTVDEEVTEDPAAPDDDRTVALMTEDETGKTIKKKRVSRNSTTSKGRGRARTSVMNAVAVLKDPHKLFTEEDFTKNEIGF